MKDLATFLGVFASLLTIVSAVIRLRWSKIQHTRRMQDKPPRPRWVRTLAWVWLAIVGITVTILVALILIQGFLNLMS